MKSTLFLIVLLIVSYACGPNHYEELLTFSPSSSHGRFASAGVASHSAISTSTINPANAVLFGSENELSLLFHRGSFHEWYNIRQSGLAYFSPLIRDKWRLAWLYSDNFIYEGRGLKLSSFQNEYRISVQSHSVSLSYKDMFSWGVSIKPHVYKTPRYDERQFYLDIGSRWKKRFLLPSGRQIEPGVGVTFQNMLLGPYDWYKPDYTWAGFISQMTFSGGASVGYGIPDLIWMQGMFDITNHMEYEASDWRSVALAASVKAVSMFEFSLGVHTEPKHDLSYLQWGGSIMFNRFAMQRFAYAGSGTYDGSGTNVDIRYAIGWTKPIKGESQVVYWEPVHEISLAVGFGS